MIKYLHTNLEYLLTLTYFALQITYPRIIHHQAFLELRPGGQFPLETIYSQLPPFSHRIPISYLHTLRRLDHLHPTLPLVSPTPLHPFLPVNIAFPLYYPYPPRIGDHGPPRFLVTIDRVKAPQMTLISLAYLILVSIIT
jgi:hypothetical protein